MKKTIGWRVGARFKGDPEIIHAELRSVENIESVREKTEYIRTHHDEFPAIWANMPTDATQALLDLQVHTVHMIIEAISITIKPYKTKKETYTVRAFPKNPSGEGYTHIDSISETDERQIYVDSIVNRIVALQRELHDAQMYFKRKGYEFPSVYSDLEKDLGKAV